MEPSEETKNIDPFTTSIEVIYGHNIRVLIDSDDKKYIISKDIATLLDKSISSISSMFKNKRHPNSEEETFLRTKKYAGGSRFYIYDLGEVLDRYTKNFDAVPENKIRKKRKRSSTNINYKFYDDDQIGVQILENGNNVKYVLSRDVVRLLNMNPALISKHIKPARKMTDGERFFLKSYLLNSPSKSNLYRYEDVCDYLSKMNDDDDGDDESKDSMVVSSNDEVAESDNESIAHSVLSDNTTHVFDQYFKVFEELLSRSKDPAITKILTTPPWPFAQDKELTVTDILKTRVPLWSIGISLYYFMKEKVDSKTEKLCEYYDVK